MEQNDTNGNGLCSPNASWANDSGIASPPTIKVKDITKMSFSESHEYFKQLLHESEFMRRFNCNQTLVHAFTLLEDELNRVRHALFTMNTGQIGPLALPEPSGATVQLSEKLYVPQKEHPDFNFVGRILGPRGMTAKQLEQATGCKIMVRGRGSMRDRKKEEQNRGKPNWEHLSEELHVLITCEDTEERAKIKLKRAVDEISRLLIPAVDGEDDLKKNQLMELAILNGTYRDAARAPQLAFPGLLPTVATATTTPRLLPLGLPPTAATLRPAAPTQTTNAPAAQPLFLAPPQPASVAALRTAATTSSATSIAGLAQINQQQLLTADTNTQQQAAVAAAMAGANPILYAPEMVPMLGLSAGAPLLEAYSGLDMQAAVQAAGAVKPSHGATVRSHPYQRINLA